MSVSAVYVEWFDAISHQGWEAIDDCSLAPQICKTLGWLIKEAEGFIVVAATYGHDGDSPAESNNRIAIPKAWIKLRKEITL